MDINEDILHNNKIKISMNKYSLILTRFTFGNGDLNPYSLMDLTLSH